MSNPVRRSIWRAVAAVLALGAVAAAAEFKEARHGPASLTLIEGMPVLHVYGTPEEMGEQQGVLLKTQIRELIERYLNRFLQVNGVGVDVRGPVLKTAQQMEKSIPAVYVREMAALARGSGAAYEDVLLANTAFDIKRALVCTTFVAVGDRSADGKPIFGRNLDFPTLGVAHEYTCVIVYHPKEGHAVASVTFPGIIGVLSGMNDAGVAAATMEVRRRDTQVTASPYALVFRAALTAAGQTDDVLKAVGDSARSSTNNLMVCDAEGRAACAELGIRAVAVRRPDNGALYSTNHFRSEALGRPVMCWRFGFVEKALSNGRKLDEELARKILLDASYEDMTMQSIVFRPAAREFLLAAGAPPAARHRFLRLKKADLFPAEQEPGP